jgi:hypothetical protein
MTTSRSPQPHEQHDHHEQHAQAAAAAAAAAAALPFPNALDGLMPPPMLPHDPAALAASQGLSQGFINPSNFPRPTVKRRKPVKWEHWEEKNLIEGVRRVSCLQCSGCCRFSTPCI